MTASVAVFVAISLVDASGGRVHLASASSDDPPVFTPPPQAWGVGVAVPRYERTVLWVQPQEDDEGGLWSDELNTDSGAFPVFVYLTNGENTNSCTSDVPLLRAPAGHLGTEDDPPFNDPGDLAGAPAGYAGGGPPPEYAGAQGDDPPVFPHDPSLSPATGWDPLLRAVSYTGTANGTSYTEGFDGPCRAARIASLGEMFAGANSVVAGLSPAAGLSWFPSLRPGQPPDGQTCFAAPMDELYIAGPGRFASPDQQGRFAGQRVPPGLASTKDPCAYYWLTATGDVFVFDLGDQASGYRTACPDELAGRLIDGGPWPEVANGYDSVGDFPSGTRPGNSTACASQPALFPGQEAYAVSPSDAVWAVQQVAGSSLLPGGLPIGGVASAGWVDGFNLTSASPPQRAGIDVVSNRPETSCGHITAGGTWCGPVSPPPSACEHYGHATHEALSLALSSNSPLAGVADDVAACGGNPRAGPLFGTRVTTDGLAFWRTVFNYDGTGRGWEVGARAYAWVMGLGGQDPYGNVVDTCVGSVVVARTGQSQWSCQESTVHRAPSGTTAPGDSVVGMNNTRTDPTTGEGFADPQ